VKIIVVGAGVLGFHAAKRLSEEGHDIVVVDVHEAELQRAQELLDVQTIHGKGSTPSVLVDAGLQTADMLLAVTGSDETNIVACLIAQTLSKKTARVARLRDPDYLGAAGIVDKSSLSIDLVVSPEQEVARSISLLAGTPGASDVLDFADGRVKALGVEIDVHSPMIGRSLKELTSRADEKTIAAGLYRGEIVSAPSDDVVINAGDVIFLVAAQESVRRALTRLGKHWGRTRHVLICGGGRMGVAIAGRLAADGVHTKIIERDRSTCERLANTLDGTVVLHGDVMDESLLEDEGVRRIDMFVSAVEDERENLLTALLARRLGAKRVVSLVNSTAYMPFASSAGVDVVLSPMLTSLGPVLQLVRRGNVISVRTLREGLVEGVEFIAAENSEIVGLPLALLHMPRGSMVGSIVRNGEVIIPEGSTTVEVGDRVVLFARPQLMPRLQRLVSTR
jgi:trk system potassium uptake protein TrkA